MFVGCKWCGGIYEPKFDVGKPLVGIVTEALEGEGCFNDSHASISFLLSTTERSGYKKNNVNNS